MRKKGFTLIELLVVITIIGMLSSVVLVSLTPARKKARDAKRESDLRQIMMAMEMCYDDPNCGEPDKYPVINEGANAVSTIDTDGNPSYLIVPKDPLDQFPYQYKWRSNTSGSQQYYCVYVKSESESNNTSHTWYCASNKGTFRKTTSDPNYEPTNTDCCGVNVTQ